MSAETAKPFKVTVNVIVMAEDDKDALLALALHCVIAARGDDPYALVKDGDICVESLPPGNTT